MENTSEPTIDDSAKVKSTIVTTKTT